MGRPGGDLPWGVEGGRGCQCGKLESVSGSGFSGDSTGSGHGWSGRLGERRPPTGSEGWKGWSVWEAGVGYFREQFTGDSVCRRGWCISVEVAGSKDFLPGSEQVNASQEDGLGGRPGGSRACRIPRTKMVTGVGPKASFVMGECVDVRRRWQWGWVERVV